ncbi:MAG: fumarylacetoacetate hydrolase family protein [Rubrivivax sp.]|jgi:2-keto-4-pentenoate hydratase/2-oxohepta-3-ene-1,7-dioic acid hydratase in catechol pathway
MKLARFDDQRLGVVLDDEIADVTGVLDHLPTRRWPFPPGDDLIAHLDALRPAIEAALPAAPRLPLAGRRWLSPVANPGKVVAAPVNYRKHIEESRADAGIHFGNEVSAIDRYALFLKATSSVVGAGEGIEIHHDDGRRTDHEVELALVIGRQARHVPLEQALSCVAGYLIGLDITIRGTEDRSWRKSLDTFTVLGPWLVTADAFGDPEAVDLRIAVNGETRQDANTRDLIWSVARCISMASSAYTLYPGDVILTGTPEGVGPIARGDTLDAYIQGIGAMQVAVR